MYDIYMCVCVKRQNKRGTKRVNRYHINKDPAIVFSMNEVESCPFLGGRDFQNSRKHVRGNASTDLADTPPMSETAGSIRACRRHMRNAARFHPTRRTMPCYRNPRSGMTRMANGRAQEGGMLYLHPRLYKPRSIAPIAIHLPRLPTATELTPLSFSRNEIAS